MDLTSLGNVAQPTLHIPPATAAALAAGTLLREGSVVRHAGTMRIHSFLREVPTRDGITDALAARASRLPFKVLAPTALTVVAVAGTAAWVHHHRTQAPAATETHPALDRLEASLRTYLDAASSASLTPEIVDDLITAYTAAADADASDTVPLTQLAPLLDLVTTHTRTLADTYATDLPEPQTPDGELTLTEHLHTQRQILHAA